MSLEINDDEPPEAAWTRARTIILGSKEFSEEERALLESSSLESVTEEVRNLEVKNATESRVRRFASKLRLKPLLDGLINLDTAIRFLASRDPHGIASLVWGGVSIVCKVNKALLTTLDMNTDGIAFRLHKQFRKSLKSWSSF